MSTLVHVIPNISSEKFSSFTSTCILIRKAELILNPQTENLNKQLLFLYSGPQGLRVSKASLDFTGPLSTLLTGQRVLASWVQSGRD